MSSLAYSPLIFFICVSASAQDNPMKVCTPILSNVEKTDCLVKVLSKVSRDMDAAYNTRLTEISPAACKKNEIPDYFCKPERIALEKSQRAFLLYLKEQCRNLVLAAYGGGSGAGLAVVKCEIVLTSYRISELKGQEAYESVPTTGGMVDYPAIIKEPPRK